MSGDGRTRWGWHELADGWASRLVAGAGVGPGNVVIDIGAGTGSLTAALVAAGARVIAVELHPVRARVLRDRFAGDSVTVVRADAADLRLPRRPFRVVANPPFAITTALLRRLLSAGSRLERADLVLPRPMATRWAAGRAPGAGRWTMTYSLRVTGGIPRRAFRPPPPDAPAVLVIERAGAAADLSPAR